MLKKRDKIQFLNISNLCWLLFGMLAIVFIHAGKNNILLNLYKWHIEQPETTQGLLEILIVFFTCAFLCIISNNKIKSFLVGFVCILYLQNHQALAPMLTAFIYIEMIISIGFSARKIFGVDGKERIVSYLLDFLVGITIWGVSAIIISLMGIGSFNHLRILTAILFCIAIIYSRRKPLIIAIKEYFEESDKVEQIMCCLLAILVLIQAAKSTRAFDYDSLWYGLRPEQVLIGENSFYDNLGMLTWVNYFPKFAELFLAPLSNLGEYSFIYSGNTVVFTVYIVTVCAFFKQIGFSKKKSHFYTFVICSTTCIANMASTAKSDLLTSLFIMLAALFFYIYSKKKEITFVFMALVSLCLALGGKINNYLYAFVVFVGGIMMIFVPLAKERKWLCFFRDTFKKRNVRLFVLLALGLFVLGGITYRTYLLTGYPLYPFTVELWKKLGFDGIYPFSNYFGGRSAGFAEGTIFDLEFYIKHIYYLIFDPSKIGNYRACHIASNWYGNFTVYFGVVVTILYLLSLKKTRNKIDLNISCLCLPTILTVVFVAVFKFQYAQDGNYYVVPVTIATIYFAKLLEEFEIKSLQKKIWYFICCMFLAIQFLIMFTSHISWSWGTAKIENNLLDSYYDSDDYRERALQSIGVLELEKYITSKEYSTPRAIGLGDEQTFFMLSAGYEQIENASSTTNGIFDTEDNLLYYLEWADINYIILPQDGMVSEYQNDSWKENYSVVWNVYNTLLLEDDVIEIKTNTYRMIDITSVTEE